MAKFKVPVIFTYVSFWKCYIFSSYISIDDDSQVTFCRLGDVGLKKNCLVWFWFSAYGCSIFSALFAVKILLSQLNCLVTFVENQLATWYWPMFISGLLVLLYWSICLSLCQYHIVFITIFYKSWNQVVQIFQLCCSLWRLL